MQRDAHWPDLAKVVHVVGRVTDEVFSFLGPATKVLAATGLQQAVVMVDDVRCRHVLPRFDDSVALVLVPADRNVVRQWRAVKRACVEQLAIGAVRAVHLHGLLPAVAGTNAVRAANSSVQVFYSPHASLSLGPTRVLGSILSWILSPVLRPARKSAIVNMPQEVQAFQDWKSVELVESPIGRVFFDQPRNEARHPLIVTGGDGAQGSELFAQLAVLLGGEALGVSFNWIGSVDPISRVRLNAAQVGVVDVTADGDLASRLAAGWLCVAAGRARGFPLFLACAMAGGLPCIAADSEQHRQMIRHGETGLLYETEHELIRGVAALIDNKELRLRLGDAARAEAERRFSEPEFGVKLLAAYASRD